MSQTFSAAVRSFRKRKGWSGTEFATKLGVWHTAVSRWETGKSAPDDGVLLRLLALAEGEPEEPIFRAAVGARMGFAVPTPTELESMLDIGKLKQAAEARSGMPIDITGQNAAKVLQAELAIIFSRENLVSPLFAEVVRYWRMMGEDPRAQQVFSDLVKYLDVNFVAFRSRPAREAIAEIEREEAARKLAGERRVMIRCPQTRHEVFTHTTATEKDWEAADIQNSEIFCPHCLATHRWSKADAFLGDHL